MGRVSGKEYRSGPVGTAPEQREHRKGGQTDRSQNVDRTDQYFLHSVQYYDRVCNLPLLHLYPVGL